MPKGIAPVRHSSFLLHLLVVMIYTVLHLISIFKMMSVGSLPVNMLNTFINRYSNLQGGIRWLVHLSALFSIRSGVRQGGPASPAIFNLHICDLVAQLRASGVGCHTGCYYVGYLLFANDVLLLAAIGYSLATYD